MRASETAALLGYPDARRDPRWREIALGEWQGRSLNDFADETAYSWRGGALTPGRGESWLEFQRRVGGAVDELVAAGGTWLVVCHGGVVRAALSHVTGADPRAIAGPREHQRHGRPDRLPAALGALRLDTRSVSALTSKKFAASSSQGPVLEQYAALILGPLKGGTCGNRPAGTMGPPCRPVTPALTSRGDALDLDRHLQASPPEPMG